MKILWQLYINIVVILTILYIFFNLFLQALKNFKSKVKNSNAFKGFNPLELLLADKIERKKQQDKNRIEEDFQSLDNDS